MRKGTTWLIVAALLMAAVPAGARQAPGSWAMGLAGGGYFFEGDQNVDDAPFFGLAVSRHFTENWAVEGLGAYGTAQVNYLDKATGLCARNADVDAFYFKVDALYFFPPEGKIEPYLSAGAGGLVLRYERGVKDEAQALVNYGGGIKYLLGERLSFRWELRHVRTFDEGQNNATLTGLFTYEFAP